MFTFWSVFLTWVATGNACDFVCFENEIPAERSLQCQRLSFLTLLSQSSSAACQVWLAALTKKGKECVSLAPFSQLSWCSMMVCVPVSAASTGSRGTLETFSFATLWGKIPKLGQEHKSEAVSQNYTLGLYQLYNLNISRQANKLRQFSTGVHLLLPLLDPETGYSRSR